MKTMLIAPDPVIFLADEDKDDVTLLGLLLRKAGADYPLEIFRGGEEVVTAFTKLLENSVKAAIRPLLCFLDIKLPPFNGLEVLRWIRAQPQLNHVPVVFISESDNPRDVTAALQNGAQCYLTKYPQPAVLREVIDEAQRFVLGTPADECFRMPTNQLLVRARRLSDKH